MRIVVFSDTHGNSIALEAVLADIERAGGVDAHWFVGDAAMIGFDPVGTVARIIGLPNLVGVRGNGDRRVATDPEIVRGVTERFIATASDEEAAIWRSTLADSEWTRDVLKAAGLHEWIAALPLEARSTLPDGTRVLLVHAAPGTDEGPGIHAGLSDDELRALLAGCDADLMFVGHTHQPLDRTVDGVRVVNLGSVSNPPREDKRAMWTLLEADEAGHMIERRYATYDLAAVGERLERDEVPARAYLRRYFG
ncbi:MAG: metallophosphoesterase family protein [Thermomicrobiales bacterium]